MWFVVIATGSALAWAVATMINDFGKVSSAAIEYGIREQGYDFLVRITHEQAEKHEAVFKSIEAACSLLGHQAAHLLCSMGDPSGAAEAQEPVLIADPRSGSLKNSPAAPVMVQYWGAMPLTPQARLQLQGLSKIESMLRDIKGYYPQCAAAYILTSAGIMYRYPQSSAGADQAAMSDYDMRNASHYLLAGPTYNAARKTVWSTIYQDEASRKPLITASTPLYSREGQFLGIAAIDLTAASIGQDILVNKHPDQLSLLQHAAPFLVDQTGVIIAMPTGLLSKLNLPSWENALLPPDALFVHKLSDSVDADVRMLASSMLASTGKADTLVIDGKKHIVASHVLRSTGWHLGLIVPEEKLLWMVDLSRSQLKKTVEGLVWHYLRVMLVALLLSLGLIGIFVRGFIKPLAMLTRAASRVRCGDLGATVAIARNDELGTLGQAFNTMVASLQQAHSREAEHIHLLENRVRERTAELSSKNAELEKTMHELSQEIAERRLAEEQTVRLSSVVEQSAEGVALMSVDGHIQYANPALTALTGYSAAELQSYNPFVRDQSQTESSLSQEIWHSLRAGNNWSGTIADRTKDGASIELKANVSVVRDHAGQVICFGAILSDITHEKMLERHLHQAQKMEAIGTLAGGIAHDFNNILAVIMGYLELSLLSVPRDDKVHSHLQQAFHATERAKALVKQILTFSRQTENEIRPVSLVPLIKEVVTFLRASLPATITIRHLLRADEDIVMADPVQLHQVLMNLCTNAKHAMQENGGTLEISLDNIFLDDGDIAFSPGMQRGAYIKLSVRDTGCGMPKEMLAKIFDPFFTTKKPGEGTGLGLAVVHGIVTKGGGAIKAYSEPGNGSVFNVYLPLGERKQPAQIAQPSETVCGGAEHILLVDDEEAIVDMTRQMLEGFGYRVTARTSSVEALQAFRSLPAGFDIVITDQTMPNMTGDELARKLRRIRHDIPVILCTGFSETIDEHKAAEMGIRAYIMKPVIRAELARAIRNVLQPLKEAYPHEVNTCDR